MKKYRITYSHKKSCRCKNYKCRKNRRGNVRSEISENAPPKDSGSEYAARTEAVGQPPSDGLEERVAHQEGAGERSQLNVGEAEFRRNETSGDRKIDAVEVGDRTQDEKPRYQQPAHAAFHMVSHGGSGDAKRLQTYGEKALSPNFLRMGLIRSRCV